MIKPVRSMIGSVVRNIWDRIPLAVKQSVLTPVYWVVSKMLFDTDVFETYHGIVIAEFGPEEGLDPLFIPKTKEALDFLAELDPRRFRRVQSEIKAIVWTDRNRYTGCYVRPPRVCMINFPSLEYDWDVTLAKKLYACTLVHEATHGLIDSRGISSNNKNRKREEKLCAEEEIRFSRRFKDGLAGDWEQLHREKLINGVLSRERLEQMLEKTASHKLV